jgi:multiple sugar transport system ATP-binding protein
MAGIQCQHLKKKYGEVEVIRDFDLDIQDHEFIVFLGPSGCGKSTILRMLAGLEDISAGQLKIGGRVVNDAEPGERGIAMVFQDYALYPHMTIRDNIAFGLRRLKTPEAEIAARVQSVAEIIGLQPVLDRKPTELSGGQQQRVAIARAIIKTPDVFLFDEPLSNLDAKLRAHMRVEIARLHKELKTTSVYVTHDQMEAMTLADRIVLLNGGDIEQVGTPEEIYRYPATLFVAGFIGTPAMNFVNVIARRDGAGWTLQGDGISLPLDGAAFDLREGQETVLGIRPSQLRLAGPGAAGGIEATVDFVEFHGDNVLVDVRAGAAELSVFVPVDARPGDGDRLMLEMAEADIHLFDRATGRTLRRSPGAAETAA